MIPVHKLIGSPPKLVIERIVYRKIYKLGRELQFASVGEAKAQFGWVLTGFKFSALILGYIVYLCLFLFCFCFFCGQDNILLYDGLSDEVTGS